MNNYNKINELSDEDSQKEENISKNNKNKKIKKDKKTKENSEEKPQLYIYKDGNSKIYSYHRDYNEYYYLRCLDRNCTGTAKYNKNIETIEIIYEYNLEYSNHRYAKEDIIKNKIKNDQIKTDDLEDNFDNQEIFFKYMLEIQPNITYYDIMILHLYYMKNIMLTKY